MKNKKPKNLQSKYFSEKVTEFNDVVDELDYFCTENNINDDVYWKLVGFIYEALTEAMEECRPEYARPVTNTLIRSKFMDGYIAGAEDLLSEHDKKVASFLGRDEELND